MRIVWCESGGRPDADENPGYWGIFQIDYWFQGWDDLATNTAAAWDKYTQAIEYWNDGWHPWPVCRWR
jgi:hypothetical protein